MFPTTSKLKLRPYVLIRIMAPLQPRQVRSLDLLHRPPYSRRSVPPRWEHILLVLQLPTKGVPVPPLGEPTLSSEQMYVLVVVHSRSLGLLCCPRYASDCPNLLGTATYSMPTVMHHQHRLSILRWNPGPARRNPTQIIAATCGRFHAVIPQGASDHVPHGSDQFIAYRSNTAAVFAFQEASTSKDT